MSALDDNFKCELIGHLQFIANSLSNVGGGSGSNSNIQLLCSPEGERILVKYSFNADGTLASAPSAFHLNGATYTGMIPYLTRCEDKETYATEYFICDNGIQKLVRVCWENCEPKSMQYFDAGRNETVGPADFNLVKLGDCPPSKEPTYTVQPGCLRRETGERVTVFLVSTIIDGNVALTKIFGVDGSQLNLVGEDIVYPGACSPDYVNGAVSRMVANGAGSIGPGKNSVSIMNVGAANGLVLGNPLLPGDSFHADAYFDYTDNMFKRLPAISYDGSGTTLHIAIQD